MTKTMVRVEKARPIAWFAALGTLAVLAFLVAGMPARASTHSDATVSLHKTALGVILVNSKGHTLYLFAKDRNDKSACSGSCATYWPPLLTARKPTAGAGVKARLLGTTRRSNGRLQVTYDRHPLYAFALDKQAGQVKGQGSTAFGARWGLSRSRGPRS